MKIAPTEDRKTVARYRMGDEIARGGMGRVLRATDVGLNRTVAIKRMLAELQADPVLRARFVREAEIAGMLEHPNIIAIYDAGLDADEMPYFTMPVVRGLTLRDVITGLWEGRVEFHRAYGFVRRVQIAIQICNAMQFAHDRGVIHRDLKPENIMIGPLGDVLIMDWGIARRLDEPDFAELESVEPRRFIGSLPYAAPEQLQTPTEVDARADVYSIGAILYELFTLRTVHAGQTLAELMRATLHADIDEPERFRHPLQGPVPRELSLLIMRALQRNRERRSANARDIAIGLASYLKEENPVTSLFRAVKRQFARLGQIGVGAHV